ncbi:peptide/nickel transport system permease protein [Actinocorallia herbida]|uniref:Peptide/nickel transport system permease protein n=1 Tax=Actinocorallia herbida TaxID=58109 RepID=A0A3N1D247_9ACTN|nr:ABC transporter permease [Actinocorallia herbida]ROO87607.1 peptide/nickel transport system permease protein [Actinocorallia herbida]
MKLKEAAPVSGHGDTATEPVGVAAEAEPRVPAGTKQGSVLVWLSYGWLVLAIGLALVAPLLPLPSYSVPVDVPRLGPGFTSFALLLGTDDLGRSELSRVISGAQVSLVVSACAGMFGFVVGSFFGLIAGYFRRHLDTGISLLTDVMLAFPPLILLLAIASIVTPNITTVVLALGVIGVPTFVRLARANTLSWSTREFVRAARNMGFGHRRILFREILPNVLPPLAAYLPIVMASMIVAEGSLSFLGLGIPAPRPSWGGMISAGQSALSDSPHIVIVPSMCIFLTVFALNQVGDHLRGRLDRTVRD